MIDWKVFYAAFNSIFVISRRQLTLFMSFLGFTSTRLGLQSVLPKDTPTKKPSAKLPRKNPRIQCSSNPGPLDYESNTLPLSHAGPLFTDIWTNRKAKYYMHPVYRCGNIKNLKEAVSIERQRYRNREKHTYMDLSHANNKFVDFHFQTHWYYL